MSCASVDSCLDSYRSAHLTVLLKATDPFQRIRLKKVQTALQSWAKKEQIPLTAAKVTGAAKRHSVCQGFHKAGIVVPYNKTTTIGYRELESDGEHTLRKINVTCQKS